MKYIWIFFLSGGLVLAGDIQQTNTITNPEFSALLKRAKSGNADAEMQLGKCYFEGQGVQENKTEALRWIEKAAEQGIVEAQMMVGISYWNGMNVKMDEKKGVEGFRKAAKQGEPGALHYLGAAYYLGKGVKQDYLESYKWSLVFRDSGRSVIPNDTASLNTQIAEIEQKLTPGQIKKGKAAAETLKKQISKFPRYSQTN